MYYAFLLYILSIFSDLEFRIELLMEELVMLFAILIYLRTAIIFVRTLCYKMLQIIL